MTSFLAQPMTESRFFAPAQGGAGGAPGEAQAEAEGEGEVSFTPVVDACRLIARHAWKVRCARQRIGGRGGGL